MTYMLMVLDTIARQMLTASGEEPENVLANNRCLMINGI